jgi:hypothetical protein
VRSLPFVESILLKVLQENLGMINSQPMFIDLHGTFVMLSLCYA